MTRDFKNYRGIFCALFLFPASVGAQAVELASTSYVQGAVASIMSALGQKVSPADLAPVAFSGDYNDLVNRPIEQSESRILSDSLSGAVTGDDYSVEMDGFIFRAIKRPATNNWAVRVVNNSGETRSISTSWIHIFGGLQGRTSGNVSFIHGAEHNPDVEVGDLGTGRQDAGITYLFDHTNMRLYRWVVSVHVDSSVMALERLH